MALFGNLFEKKYCAVCGEEIKLMGNRKLEDGNLCKNCASRLSPWFDERRHSTVEQIKEQLAYREENKNVLKGFHADETYGKSSTKLLIDRTKGCFLVGNPSRLEQDNPDVVSLDAITSYETKIQEHKTEQKYKNEEGKTVSYDPPQYTYTYDFTAAITVTHPYFDDMHFRLNTFAVKDLVDEYQEYVNIGNDIAEALTGIRPEVPETIAAAQQLSDWHTNVNALAQNTELLDSISADAAEKAGMTQEQLLLYKKNYTQLMKQAVEQGVYGTLIKDDEIRRQAADASFMSTEQAELYEKLVSMGMQTALQMQQKQ